MGDGGAVRRRGHHVQASSCWPGARVPAGGGAGRGVAGEDHERLAPGVLRGGDADRGRREEHRSTAHGVDTSDLTVRRDSPESLRTRSTVVSTFRLQLNLMNIYRIVSYAVL